MPGVSDFVRGTLAFLSNCALAMLTLLAAAVRLRPVVGAVRCKVRYERHGSEHPDGRTMLFLCSVLLAAICTQAFGGSGEAVVGIARLALGSAGPSSLTVLTACALYFACEWTIARATRRRLMPGRRGGRNRTVLRFLMAALVLEFVVYAPVALFVVRHMPPGWFELTGDPESFVGGLYDHALLMVRVVILIAPFTFLHIALSRSRSLRPDEETARLLGALPLLLLGACIVASLLTGVLYPPVQPATVFLRCRVAAEEGGARVTVEARFVNEGPGWWTPHTGLRVNLLRAPSARDSDWSAGVAAAHMLCAAPDVGETALPLVVAPRSDMAFRRHVLFEDGSFERKEITGCSLSTDEPGRSLLDRRLHPAPRGPEFLWSALVPRRNSAGDVVFAAASVGGTPTTTPFGC